MTCATCEGVSAPDGTPCPTCKGAGHLAIGCPQAELSPDVRELSRLTSMADAGLWPQDGGAMSQTRAFLDGYRVLTNEVAMWQADRDRRNGNG